MKKLCLILVLLSGVSFASSIEVKKCVEQEIGGCEYLYSCPNDITILVKKNIDTVGTKNNSTCRDEVSAKYLVDKETKSLIELKSK